MHGQKWQYIQNTFKIYPLEYEKNFSKNNKQLKNTPNHNQVVDATLMQLIKIQINETYKIKVPTIRQWDS